MAKIFISLLLLAAVGGILASASETAQPGSLLYSFKTGVTDNVAAALCSAHFPCSK